MTISNKIEITNSTANVIKSGFLSMLKIFDIMFLMRWQR